MRSWTSVVATVSVLCLSAVGSAEELGPRVQRLVSLSGIPADGIGISVVSLDEGRVLAEHNPVAPLIPASNMKLVTSGVALLQLGPEFSFRTEFKLDGPTLHVVGVGDPAFADPRLMDEMSPPMTVEGFVGVLAEAVKNAGVTHLDEIVIDDRVFDREWVHPSWPTDQLNEWYCAEVSGLNFHTNVLAVYPRPSPSGAGSPPIYDMQPRTPWLPITVKARTVDQGANTPWMTRAPDTNEMTLFGNVRVPSQAPVEITVHEVPTFFGRVLAAELVKRGVSIGSDSRSPLTLGRDERLRAVRLVDPDAPRPEGRVVAAVSTRLHDVLVRCNTNSQNLFAESLIKRLGHEVTGGPGSWANGAAVVRMVLTENLGPDAMDGVVVTDGSGMSRLNLVTARFLTEWLAFLHNRADLRDQFLETLPTPGEGTLRRRFRGDRPANIVRAKSGSLDGVRCLSGYVLSEQSGRTIAFSVLVNGVSGSKQTRQALDLAESVVAEIDGWLAEREGVPSASVRNE